MVLEVLNNRPVLHSCMYDRTQHAARGFAGGQDGAVGEVVLDDGKRPHPKGKYLLQPGQRVTLRLPGGGGFFPPWERDPDRVLEDVRQDRVSVEAAREIYGVVLDLERGAVDAVATATLRKLLQEKD